MFSVLLLSFTYIIQRWFVVSSRGAEKIRKKDLRALLGLLPSKIKLDDSFFFLGQDVLAL